jgi:hypothetical protein
MFQIELLNDLSLLPQTMIKTTGKDSSLITVVDSIPFSISSLVAQVYAMY